MVVCERCVGAAVFCSSGRSVLQPGEETGMEAGSGEEE